MSVAVGSMRRENWRSYRIEGQGLKTENGADSLIGFRSRKGLLLYTQAFYPTNTLLIAYISYVHTPGHPYSADADKTSLYRRLGRGLFLSTSECHLHRARTSSLVYC